MHLVQLRFESTDLSRYKQGWRAINCNNYRLFRLLLKPDFNEVRPVMGLGDRRQQLSHRSVCTSCLETGFCSCSPRNTEAEVRGEVIEDRGSQITFSALGQQAPLEAKNKSDPDYAKRKKIKGIRDTLIPEFSVRVGGATSIDITKPGIDKPYGIRKLRDTLGI